jgi:hypothetical protein
MWNRLLLPVYSPETLILSALLEPLRKYDYEKGRALLRLNFNPSNFECARLLKYNYSSNQYVKFSVDVAKPRVDNIIPAFDLQLVLDASPESCGGISFTRRFTYRVPQRPAHERNSVRFLSFSDDSIPQNCRLTLFLQKPCEQFPDSCRNGEFSYNK